jgi:hypothetical protein
MAVWAKAVDGAIRFLLPPTPKVQVTEAPEFHDSGFSLLPYPMASQSTGLPYGTLSRQGAGL